MGRARDERGAVAVFTALLTTTVLTGFASFSIDIGYQRMAARDMQAVADLVAMDMARHLDGSSTATLLADPAWAAAVTASRDRQGETLGDALNLKSCGVAASGEPTLDGTGICAYPGILEDDGGFAGGAAATHVKVLTRTDVDYFLPIFAESGSAARSAVAKTQSSACFQLGSFAASVNPSASPVLEDILKPLVGASTIGLLGYDGLAAATIALIDLIKAPTLNVGTVNELLALENVTVSDVLLAEAHVLRANGKGAEAQVLETAAVQAVAGVEIEIGELIGLSTSDNAALSTQFNAMDLFLGSVFLANGTNFLAIPNLQAGVPSVGVTTAQLQIIERPQRACNDDEAKTAQIKLAATAKANLNASPLPLGPLLNLKLIDPATGNPNNDIAVDIDIDVAGAHGHLTDVDCSPVEKFRADIWTDLVQARVSATITVKGTVKATVLGIAGVNVPVQFKVALSADASKPASVSSAPASMDLPPNVYGDHVEVGSGTTILPNLTASMVSGTLATGPLTVLGLPVPTSTLDAIVNPILDLAVPAIGTFVGATVNPLIGVVNTNLSALTTALGINVAGADFYPLARPVCNNPALRG
ncbi:hypothetical protein [Nocardioides cavernaquae]|uniref:Uncharacterized protein n=1 Tax=Nocardioides cavernaquae TaxID=2321396 RepID=A0A3A5H2B0_9ACTN|nr:hypothetical protein [Nocardioides cavernaquae]RJS44933.1 hypothetical protein D4739_00860 [Nocardioides cavernaquae]